MSYVLSIGATNFDGVTVTSLAGIGIDPATEQFVYSFVNAGRIQLWTGPWGATTPLWIQRASRLGIAPPNLALRFPNGVIWPLVDDWNLLVPQGTELVATGGGPANTTLYVRTINADNWHRMQCCHQFNPNECVPPVLVLLNPDDVVDPFTGDIVISGTGFLPTDDVIFDLQGPGNPITINSVTWNSSTQITVNITTDGDAAYLVSVTRDGDPDCASNTLPFVVNAA